MAEQERPVVAYLGPEASYTHQAALSSFANRNITLSPCITIADVFTAVQSGAAYRGVVPFENSSNGSVVFTLDLIGDIHGLHPDIRVCGENYVAVKHCLLGHASPTPHDDDKVNKAIKMDANFNNPLALPKSDLTRIKKLYSHPQAWGQCKAFLSMYLKGVERQDVSSTSRAAEMVKADTSGESAALSSKVAAEVFGLDLLAENINDRVGNTTRFLVIQKEEDANAEPRVGLSTGMTQESVSEQDWKTLITFTVDHGNPGALLACLAAFAKYSLNMTSINTRPSGVENWNYIFFVELMGRKERDDGDVNKALKELEGVCRGYKWQGSWEKRLAR